MNLSHKKKLERCFVKFFSGFGFQNEQELFNDFLPKGEYVVAGFSYGAIKAFEYVLNNKNRIDRLILLSPAFFQNTSDAFKRTQMRYFNSNKDEYMKNFIHNVCLPNNYISLQRYICEGEASQLNALLSYKWKVEDIKNIIDKNVKIEVFFGEMDNIIDTKIANDFFSKLTTTYFIKKAGHLLDVK